MHFIRNWPEGLFILLVGLGPIAAAWATSQSVGRFLLAEVVFMGVGFLLWLAVIWTAATLHDRSQRE